MDGMARAKREQARVLAALFREFEWIHISLGLFGNVCFFIGSLLYFVPEQHLETWFFVFGSGGMLVGTVGSAVVRWEERQRRNSKRRSSAGNAGAGEKDRV